MSKKVKTSAETEVEEEETQKSKLREFLEFIAPIVIALVVAMILKYCIFANAVIPTGSMLETIQKGDRVIASRLEYKFNDPERFDIAIFKYPDDESQLFVKRIIGLPGETVQVKDGAVYINGELLDENYGAEPMNNAGIAAEPITLGEDEYFVLGDNRNHSSDSREPSVGVLTRSQLIGRAWVRIYPFNKIGVVKHG